MLQRCRQSCGRVLADRSVERSPVIERICQYPTGAELCLDFANGQRNDATHRIVLDNDHHAQFLIRRKMPPVHLQPVEGLKKGPARSLPQQAAPIGPIRIQIGNGIEFKNSWHRLVCKFGNSNNGTRLAQRTKKPSSRKREVKYATAKSVVSTPGNMAMVPAPDMPGMAAAARTTRAVIHHRNGRVLHCRPPESSGITMTEAGC